MRTLIISILLLIACQAFAQPKKGFGLKLADSATLARENFLVPPRTVQGIFPSRIDLAGNFPPIGYQGDIGDCSSWACVYAIRSFLEKSRQGYTYVLPNGSLNASTVFSPLYIFNQVKDLDKRCDSVGSAIGENLEKMRLSGVCKMKTYNPKPYDTFPCCEDNPLTKPNAVREARNFKIDKYGWIFRDNPFYNSGYKLGAIKEFLVKGYPVILSMSLDSSFYKFGGQWYDTAYIWREPDQYTVGNHAVVCVGYDDAINAIRIFNSWATSWGNNGFGYISYDVIDQKIFEGYIVNPASDITVLPGGDITVNFAPPQHKPGDNFAPVAAKSENNFFIENRYQPYNNLRIMPIDVNRDKGFTVFKTYEVIDGKPYEKDIFTLNIGDHHTFTNNGVKYDFTLNSINRWNGFLSKNAAFYTMKIN